MKVAIIGPGAMGCLFGGFLALSGEEVWLLDRQGPRARRLNEQGIQIEGISGKHKAKVRATTDPKEIGKAELVVISVKSYDTSSVAKLIPGLIAESTPVLTLQNGVGNLEELAQAIEPSHLAGGITSQGATVLGPGHIRHAGKGETVIGPYQGKGRNLEGVAAIFNKAGFPTKVAGNVQDLLWSKLIINVGINALTAITRLNNGRLPEFAGTKDILRCAVEEALAVAKKKGIKLIFDEPIARVEAVCRATSGNVASMLQDVLKKRRTEINYINGAILRESERLKIPTPVNRVLTELVKTIETSYEKRVEKI